MIPFVAAALTFLLVYVSVSTALDLWLPEAKE